MAFRLTQWSGHTLSTIPAVAMKLATGSIPSIKCGCSAGKAWIPPEPVAMGFSTTCGDTCPTQTSPPRTKGDFREPVLDLELLSLPPSGLLRVEGFFLSPVVLCRNCPC